MRTATSLIVLATLATACEETNPTYTPTQTALVEGSLRQADPMDPQSAWIGEEVTTVLTSAGDRDCETARDVEARPIEYACDDCQVVLKIDVSALAELADCAYSGSSLTVGSTLTYSTDGIVRIDNGNEILTLAPGELGANELTWRRVVQIRDGRIVDDFPFRDMAPPAP